MPNEYGVYIANGSEADATFLREHFVKGTKWEIFEFGYPKGIFTVGDRFEMGGAVRNHIVRDRDDWRGEAFLSVLEAKPYKK